MEPTRPELGTGKPGRPAGPTVTRRRQALVWAFYIAAGIAQASLLAWAVERFDFSPTVIGGYALWYVGLGYFTWLGFRGRLNEPPLELGLARGPAVDDPSG